jgi:hypothetical protein
MKNNLSDNLMAIGFVGAFFTIIITMICFTGTLIYGYVNGLNSWDYPSAGFVPVSLAIALMWFLILAGASMFTYQEE